MSDDLISRQAAIEVLSLDKELLSRALDDMDVVGTDREKYSWGLGLIESYISDMKDLPSAQPKRKKGQWCEHYSHEDGERDGVQCSECGTHYYFGGQLMNFCPNCGARMDGGAEE